MIALGCKWIKGCKFEARMEEVLPDFSKYNNVSISSMDFEKRYVCDICVTCGKVVERSKT